MLYLENRLNVLFCTLLLLAAAEDSEGLSLKSAVQIALENNADFKVNRASVELRASELGIAESRFIPRFKGQLRYDFLDQLATANDLNLIQHKMEGSAGLVGRLAIGTEYAVEWGLRYEHLNALSTIYAPFHSTTVQLRLTQPLLRGAWLGVNRAPIRIASLEKTSSEEMQQARLMQVLADVEIAYWRLFLAQNEREVLEKALELARQQEKESRTQLRLGSGTAINIVDAQFSVARGKSRIEESNRNIAEAEGQLLRLLQPPEISDRRYRIIDTPDIAPSLSSAEAAISMAMEKRPELRALKAQTQAAQVTKEMAENALWPRVDFVAQAGLTGGGGRFSNGFGTSFFGTPLTHGITGEQLQPVVPDPALEGGVGAAFKNLNNPFVALALEVEIPLSNARAEAEVQRSAALLTQRRAAEQRIRSLVQAQVVIALRQLEADQARVLAAGRAVVLAQELMVGQKKRFKNGVAVSFDVLRATNGVAQAQIEQLRARVSTRISRARLALAMGTYLEESGVKLERDQRED